MANQNSHNTDISLLADGMQIAGGTIKRILKWLGSNITLTGSGSNTYTFPASTDTLVGRASTDTLTNKTLTAPVINNPTGFMRIVSLSSDAAANSSTTPASITGLEVSVDAGTYIFQYYIRYQAAATTTGVDFAVDHTGTVTSFLSNMQFVSTGGAAATAAATQVGSSATGNIMEGFSQRTKNTLMGPTVSVDAANSDMMMLVEGIIVVSTTGTLKLMHASEVAAASTVKAGTTLILIKSA